MIKKGLNLISIVFFASCNFTSQDVEKKFFEMNDKIDSISKIENIKIDSIFKQIYTANSSKVVREESKRIYYSLKDYNKCIDSLLYELEMNGEKSDLKVEFFSRFSEINSVFKNKLDSITRLNHEIKVDSLFYITIQNDSLPYYALETSIKSTKLDIIKYCKTVLLSFKRDSKDNFKNLNILR